ncbi:AraC family transcriptional regulator [Conexibacter woesei]|uniref:Transcriptional regulator, AraC family n=1 Tax=Conexibacter woesei (strain DSM 14684 / CCUG 47730 / CIP 108061 / JCM 11494 / NBRC 100937 / ID131577) TaxID=469383 RepID=D3EZW8_CONWI|nr:AraC family transcriptional regulator [Conexibacter woesei]ADB49944.1 transcriptional regulator, AraC family [Conexibacter woesei DSM 14684]
MDVLADLLARAHARGAVFSNRRFAAPWGVEFQDVFPLTFHAVLGGAMWVELEGEEPLQLFGGDLLLVRTGAPYRFVHAPGAPAVSMRRLLDGEPEQQPQPQPPQHDGPATQLLCGAYTLEGSVCDSLLASLPSLAPIRGGSVGGPLRTALGLLGDEVATEEPGQQTVLDRLLDLLLVYSLRAWFTRPEADVPGWYAALEDPAAGPALRAIHSDPAHQWTVAELAALAGLSRAAFARRFSERVGEAPLAYLTRWRMSLAAGALLRPGATLAAVAQEVGYGSEFALSNAFRRTYGEAPGRWRRAQLAEAAAAASAAAHQGDGA